MNFDEAAIEMFPEIVAAGTITRAQAMRVKETHNLKFPHHIVNPNNSVGRGVFKFTATAAQLNVQVVEESDEQIDSRIRETYANMKLVTESVASGTINSLLISGAAGVGKSFLVKKTLEESTNCAFTYIRGFVKPTGIFKLLWENRFSHQVLIFDDADSIFEDAIGLNLLKAALELTQTRKICWMSEKEFISEDGETIPSYFDYEGQIIFLTNVDFREMIAKGNKLSPHLAALESRSLYLDLKVKTNREKMIRIRQVVGESNILADRGIYADECEELMQFLVKNTDKLRDISLRTVEKLATLYLTSPTKWQSLAKEFMFK